MSRYDDIINLPHHVSMSHPQMPTRDRAAQFSPFAALTGYETVVAEVGRHTAERQEIDEQSKIELNQRLQILLEHLSSQPEVCIEYFVPDALKAGGEYKTAIGKITKIKLDNRTIQMADGSVIRIDDLSALNGTIFDNSGDL